MEAFSDGVLAILITVMLLELREPDGDGWHALGTVLPNVAMYLLSFVYIGIYWNNHHHLLHLTERVTGAVLWANLHLLFWLSLVPVTTRWLGRSDFADIPTAVYGIVLLAAGVAYYVLQTVIIKDQGPGSVLAAAVGEDWKGKASPLLYTAGILLSFLDRWFGLVIYVAVAVMWFVPDRRVESVVADPPLPTVDRTPGAASPGC